MSKNQPLCCTPRAYNLLSAQLQSINSSDALLNGSMAIAMHEIESASVQEVDAILQGYADKVRSRCRGSQQQALVAHLHNYLFDELGFTGNTQDYYNPMNSYLPAVLRTRRGLPITLSLIYKLVAERLGLRAWGVGLPGHFIAAIEMGGSNLLIDPFTGGREITVNEAHARLKETFGPEIEWSDELVRAASNRHWLTRMLQNLLNVFGNQSRYSDVAAILELEMLLWPDQVHLQRDLGLVLARCGLSRPASIWIDRYLSTNPDDPQKSQLQELLQVLGK